MAPGASSTRRVAADLEDTHRRTRSGSPRRDDDVQFWQRRYADLDRRRQAFESERAEKLSRLKSKHDNIASSHPRQSAKKTYHPDLRMTVLEPSESLSTTATTIDDRSPPFQGRVTRAKTRDVDSGSDSDDVSIPDAACVVRPKSARRPHNRSRTPPGRTSAVCDWGDVSRALSPPYGSLPKPKPVVHSSDDEADRNPRGKWASGSAPKAVFREWKAETDHLVAKLVSTEQRLHSAEASVTKLRRKLAEETSNHQRSISLQVGELTRQLQNKKELHSELVRENNKSNQEVSRLRVEMERWREQASSLDRTSSRLQGIVVSLEENLVRETSKVATLQQELEEYKRKAADFEAKFVSSDKRRQAFEARVEYLGPKEAEAESLQSLNAELTSKVEHLSRQVKEYATQCASQHAQSNSLKTDCEKLVQELRAAQQGYEDASSALRSKTSRNETLEAECTRLTQEAHHWRQQAEEAGGLSSERGRKYDLVQAECATLRDKVDGLRRDHARAVSELQSVEARRIEVEQDLVFANEQVSSLKRQCGDFQAKVMALQSRCQTLEEERSELISSSQRVKGSYEDAAHDAREKTSRLVTAEHQCQTLSARCREQATSLDMAQNRVRELESSIESVSRERDFMATKIDALSRELDDLRTDYKAMCDTHEMRLDEATNQLHALRAELTAASATKASLENRVAQLEQDLFSHQEEARRWQGQLERLQERSQEDRTKLAAAESEAARLGERAAALQTELSDLRGAEQVSRRSLQTVTVQLEEANAHVRQLRAQEGALQRDRDDLRAALDDARRNVEEGERGFGEFASQATERELLLCNERRSLGARAEKLHSQVDELRAKLAAALDQAEKAERRASAKENRVHVLQSERDNAIEEVARLTDNIHGMSNRGDLVRDIWDLYTTIASLRPVLEDEVRQSNQVKKAKPTQQSLQKMSLLMHSTNQSLKRIERRCARIITHRFTEYEKHHLGVSPSLCA